MYCLNDFEESLKQVTLEARPIAVLRAWGQAENDDVCCHMDWHGGFVMLLANSRYAYLTGWCDYTGWGCQDGAEVVHGDHYVDLDFPDDVNWDICPADLNKWITEGMKSWEERGFDE